MPIVRPWRSPASTSTRSCSICWRGELLVQPVAGQTVVELAYTPDGADTALVAAARKAGCVVIDGLEALVRQGAKSFELWTGVPAPLEVMRTAVRGGP